MKRLCSLFLVSLLFIASAQAADIKLMTQNQYLGADLGPVLAAPDAAAFNTAVVYALQMVAANLPAERMQALAADIAREQPALVGVQEAFTFYCVDYVQPPIPGAGCGHPSLAGAFSDHLAAVLEALDGAYVAAAEVINFNVAGIPFIIDGVPAFIGVVDRDVILARADVEAVPVDYSSVCAKPVADGCNYSFVLSANTPFGALNVERGFVAVDATVDGKAYRLVNTHLEVQRPDPTNPVSQVFQSAQSMELLQILGYTTPPDRSLIVLGDFNSSPEHPAIPGPLPLPAPFDAGIPTPYQLFTGMGYTDVWTLRPGNTPGFTCCQVEDLSNQKSVLNERIDIVFAFEPPIEVKKARVTSAKVSDKTWPPGFGLWPSDHGSVSVTLRY
jgi:endonuclease/exonuclease/phosphatase family metal-dependent hydrolase